MMKLGTFKEIELGTLRAWGYDIKEIWLCKRTDINTYVLMGLCWDGEKAHGWCTLKSGTLKEVRAYARAI